MKEIRNPKYIKQVGGIPEVLPEEYIQFVEPDASSIEEGLCLAVERVISG